MAIISPLNYDKARVRPPPSYVDDNDDDDDSVTDRTHLLYAQKLNTNAVMCIEIGYYERAILSLQEALKFSQKQSDESLTQVCRCDGCMVDGGIDFSDDFVSNENRYACRTSVPSRGTKGYDDEASSDEEDDCRRKKKDSDDEYIASMTKSISQPRVKKVSLHNRNNNYGEGKNASWSIKDEYCDEELHEHKDEEIYKRPIRVTREGHPIGSSLFLIITFNLALAHHLEVATSFNHRSYDPKAAKKTLLFYELTSTYEKRILADSNNCWDSLSSIRFNTILNNNLNQILQMLPDKCLPATHRLLSNISDAINNGTEQFSSRNSKASTTKKGSKSNGESSRKGGSSRLSRSKKSPTTSGKSKLQLALGDMPPTASGKSKLKLALGDMAPTTK